MATTTKITPAVVLLVEDDPGDQLLTREAFQSLQVPHELRVVSDGKEALDYLYRRGPYASAQEAPRPDLILLDLNMPRVTGQRVAEQIHSDPNLRGIPVVVLTTSQRHEDMLRAYGRGVTSFITKPLDFDRFIAAVRDLERLIKYVLAIKTVRRRARLSDRQIFRLLRRQRELEESSGTVFEQQMQQLEKVLAGCGEAPSEEDAGLARREEVARVAQKILEAAPARRARAAKAAERSPFPATPGLLDLARILEEAEPSRRADSPSPGGDGGEEPV
jgi:CheY-like chemotaxis protein